MVLLASLWLDETTTPFVVGCQPPLHYHDPVQQQQQQGKGRQRTS
jgi:hypothetical protein